MSSVITVRNLDETTQRIIRHRAVDNGRSFEAEIRAILVDSAQGPATEDQPTIPAVFAAAERFREEAAGLDITWPPRPEQPLTSDR